MRFDSKIFQRFISGQASDEEFEQVERYLSEQPDIALAEFDTCEDTLVSVLREGYENGQAPVNFENGELNDPSWEIVAQNLNRQFTLATRQLDISQYVDPPQSDEEVGRIGNYRLLKQIGSGGMGIVFEAKPVDSDLSVAIKLMNPLLAANPEAAYRFRRESLAAAKLTHDKIVKISEVDQASSIPFLVMELLRGESLAQRLRRDDRLSADKIIDYSIQVSEALEYAHARGILHRDIKPDNIWIDENEQVKLLDFGLARTIDDQTGLTQTGAILGTPKYMSPEQAKGRNVDHRSDLFSLGSVMYEMLIGRPAFDRENFYSTILAVANDEVTDFESKRLETNTGLHRIVTQLLHKAPEKRIESATALKKELESVDPSEMLEPQAHVGRGGGNNWKSILLGFAAAALLFCFSIIIYVQTDRGTLVIDAGDDVEVSVVNETVKIRELGSDKEYTLKVGENRLPSGAYEIVVTDPATGLELSTTHFSLKRGGKELVNVGLKESNTGVAASDGDGRSLRGNPNGIGISPNAPARSITEVLSPAKVGEEWAITKNNPINEYSLISNPIELPNTTTWSLESRDSHSPFSLWNTDLAFNHDGSLLAASDQFGTVRIWKYSSNGRELVHVIPNKLSKIRLAWSPVENVLMVGCIAGNKGNVVLWRIGKSVTIIDQANAVAAELGWSPSGTKIAIQVGRSSEAHVHLFDVSKGRLVGIPNQGIKGEITQRPWSFDERFFASSKSVNRSAFIEVYDIDANRSHHLFKDCRAAAWSAKSQLLVLWNESQTQYEFWDINSLKRVSIYGRNENEWALDFRSGNNKFAVLENYRRHTGNDKPLTIKTIDLEKVRNLDQTFAFDETIATKITTTSDVAIGNGGHWVASSPIGLSDHNHQAIDQSNWRSTFTAGSTLFNEAINFQSGIVATLQSRRNSDGSGDYRLVLHQIETGKQTGAIHLPVDESSSIRKFDTLKFSGPGNLLLYSVETSRKEPGVSTSNENDREYKLFVFDVRSKEMIFEYQFEEEAFPKGTFSPDEKLLFVGESFKVLAFDLQTKQAVNEFSTSGSRTKMHPLAKQATILGCDDESVYWEASAGKAPMILRSNLKTEKTEIALDCAKIGFEEFNSIDYTSLDWCQESKTLAVAWGDSSAGYRVKALSLDQNEPTTLFEKAFKASAKPTKVRLSQSGKQLLFIEEKTSSGRRIAREDLMVYFYDLYPADDPEIDKLNGFGTLMSGNYFVTPIGEGFWIINEQYQMPYIVSQRYDLPTWYWDGNKINERKDRIHPHLIQSHQDGTVIREWNALSFFDKSGNKSRTVFLEESYQPSGTSWFGKLASERFGPWVKQAPGTYLVTISDYPDIGIVTEPLDEVRSKYPQLFAGSDNEGATSVTNHDSNGSKGINLSHPRRSVTEVLSPDTVGKELAIEPGKAIGMYSQFVDPVKLPDIETWTIVSETRTYFSDMSFSMDGSLLAAGSSDNSVRIWEYEDQSRKLKHILPLNGQVKHVSWSPVQNVLLVSCVNGDAGTVSIWHVDDRLTIIDQVPILANSVAWSPSGTKVAIQSDQVEFFDVSLGRFSKLVQQQIKGEFSKKAWSQDERYFAVSQKNETSKLEGGARVNTFTWETFVYDLVEKRLHHSFQNARNAAWSSNSSRLAFEHTEPGAQKAERVEFWDMDEIEKISEHQLQNEEVVDWTSTTNSFAIVQSSWSKEPNQLESSKLKTLDFSNVDQKQNALAFDWSSGDINDSRRVNAVVGPNRHWACPSYFGINDHLHQYQTPSFWGIGNYATMNKTGTRLVSFEENYPNRDLYRIAVYQSKNGKLITQSEIPIQPEKRARVSSMRVSDSGKYVYLVISLSNQSAGGNRQTTFKTIMYDVDKNTILFSFVDPPVLGDERYFTPDEKRLVDVGKTHVNVLDVQTGEVIHKFVREEPQTGSRRFNYSSRFLKSLIHLNNQRLLWFVAERGDWKIIECDLASAETKTVLSLGKMKEIAQSDRYSLDPIKLFWNEQSNCIVVAGRSTKLVPSESGPGRHSEKAYELLVISLEGEAPVIKHSLNIDGFNQARMQSVHSESGDLFYYRTIETIDDRDLATEHVFIDLSDLNAKPRRFTVDLGDFKLNGFSKSGILFADQNSQTFKTVDVNGTVTSYKTKTRANLVYFASDIYIFQNGRHLSYFDQTGKHNHSVVLDNDYGAAQQHWHGKIGADRFGPWVKKAPGEYLVTISDDPEVGVVTVPLDEARLKYPELFWEK